jgi:hypothetical protein
MPRSRSRAYGGAAWGLAVYFAASCAVAGSLVSGMYNLMQPTRVQNPGVAAYKPPPAVAFNFTGYARPASEVPPPVAVAMEPVVETVAVALPQVEVKRAPEVKKETPSPRRQAARRQERRSPRTDYAYQRYQPYQPYQGYQPYQPYRLYMSGSRPGYTSFR